LNLAGYLFRSLREAGVEVAFGDGGSDAFLWEAAEAAGLRTVPLLTARSALDAAGAYRRAAGRPAVVLSPAGTLAALAAPAGGAVPVLTVTGAGRGPGLRRRNGLTRTVVTMAR